MLGRLRHLFRRYADHHQDIACPGFALIDERGQTLGYLERIRIHGRQVSAEGWAEAEAVSLISPAGEVKANPQLLRMDVLTSRGAGSRADVGFALTRPLEEGQIHFCVETGAGRYLYGLPMPRQEDVVAMRRRLWPGFLAAVIRAAPALLRWQKTADPRDRIEIKRALGLAEDLGPRPWRRTVCFWQTTPTPARCPIWRAPASR